MNNGNIAYICLCHMDPQFVARTAKTLRYKNDGFFIHVDNKVDITPFLDACKGLDNVHFVIDRIDNYWGGFNSVVATVKTLELAQQTGEYARFVLLQGQDYPLVSPQRIHEFFEKNAEVEYCKARDITISKETKDRMKLGGLWFLDAPAKTFFSKLLKYGFYQLNGFKIPYRRRSFRHKGANWHIYQGWAQFALTKCCVDFIVDEYHNNTQFNRFIKHRFPPDEIYFHTLIYNSEFRKRMDDTVITRRSGEKTLLNLTYFEYPSQVLVFSKKEEFAFLKETGCLFVRKVNSSSEELLDEIDSSFTALQ